ncbi:bacillithiol system redox-active protein YtxJ [Pseudozobellia thermophila]|uniref:Bacillithiol system protein YtxJ n=1 Tax=Pseudozobellia thermophila TaxID=192903 RepID=A0A1M6F7R1_9FLAO|nr:bacillithiol system redox-active protein YtxJ [Pseudozobellia thermophila]SHI93702.1 bacillithiol system protein YtxJ [Pseudozobellia thermophila]
MGLFSGFFGGSGKEGGESGSKVPWLALSRLEQLDDIVEKSHSRPQVIFKHSTTCGISRMVLNMFNRNYGLSEGQMDFYFLDLHQFRDVSDGVATRFGIVHQSPQLLVVKNGTVVAHDSHGAITDLQLDTFV